MRLIATIRCDDTPGVVRAVAEGIVEVGGNIVESGQFTDQPQDLFVMRVVFDTPWDRVRDVEEVIVSRLRFLDATVMVRDARSNRRMVLMVSKFDHCLADLLYRRAARELNVDIPLIVSNHTDAAALAERYATPFVHLPVTADIKQQAEARLLELVDDVGADFLVLARYMQVLSPELCTRLSGKVINIHHSFLPGFKGGRPYQQAFERGVKLIGATAHYVTADLDEGPIIEQDVVRVSHTDDVDRMVALGRDVERTVLARAVRSHAEDRVFLAGPRTYVL